MKTKKNFEDQNGSSRRITLPSLITLTNCSIKNCIVWMLTTIG